MDSGHQYSSDRFSEHNLGSRSPPGSKACAPVSPVLLRASRCCREAEHSLIPTHLSPHTQEKNAQILLICSYTLVTFSCLKHALFTVAFWGLFLSKPTLQRYISCLKSLTSSTHNFANKSTSKDLFRPARGRPAEVNLPKGGVKDQGRGRAHTSPALYVPLVAIYPTITGDELPDKVIVDSLAIFLIGLKLQGEPFKGTMVKKCTATGCKEQHVQPLTPTKRQLLILSGVSATTLVLIPAHFHPQQFPGTDIKQHR